MFVSGFIRPSQNIEYGNDGFFDDFYFKIKEKLQTEEILPAKNETFANKRNAYWADSPDLANLFSKSILDLINCGSFLSQDLSEPPSI